MSEQTDRVEQFRKMAEADPSNELGHFSLGRALLDAGDATAAAQSFERVISINPNIGKVYQLLAQAQLKLEQKDLAIATLKKGATISAARGDMMPKNEMVTQLKELGAEVPAELAGAVTATAVGEGELLCRRCGLVKRRLPAPPFRNAMGQEIFGKICADCWREWIGMGTKVINELRLPLSDPQAQKVFDQHMVEFLNLR